MSFSNDKKKKFTKEIVFFVIGNKNKNKRMEKFLLLNAVKNSFKNKYFTDKFNKKMFAKLLSILSFIILLKYSTLFSYEKICINHLQLPCEFLKDGLAAFDFNADGTLSWQKFLSLGAGRLQHPALRP